MLSASYLFCKGHLLMTCFSGIEGLFLSKLAWSFGLGFFFQFLQFIAKLLARNFPR